MKNTLCWLPVALTCLALLGLPGCGSSSPQTETGDDASTNADLAAESQPNADSTNTDAESIVMKVTSRSFGRTADGQETLLFTCTNNSGLTVAMTNYGATLVSVETPDRRERTANIILGFESVSDYEKHTAYFGCAVGRYANRIAKGKFTLDDKEYTLATNNGPNHLHGGEKGFNRKVWQAEPVEEASQVGVRFRYRSTDGEEGYPGTLDTTVTYLVTGDNRLIMDYAAETDQATVLNLTNHSYWNLAGAGTGAILEHELTLAADKYLGVDDTLIPTGEKSDVAGTPMDFTRPRAIGARIEELTNDPRGYDHCYVLRDREEQPTLAARVREPKRGRVMEVYTTQPGIQFYTGNFLDGDEVNGGHQKHAALCLETQHFPDSPNRPDFPSTVLRPGEKFHQVTIHKFLTE